MLFLRHDSIRSSGARSGLGVILAVSLLLTSVILLAQAPPTPFAQLQSASVEGIVKNQATGQPIADVRVGLAPDGGGGTAKNAVTDSEGRFAIRDVAPGRYNVTATRTLFFRPPRTSGATVLSLSASQQYKDLQIYLLPTAVIAGRITDDNRQALRSVRVEALRSGYRDGQVFWLAAGTATSDDRGEYRLFNLPPGTYYVRATRLTSVPQTGQAYYPGVLEPRDAIPMTLDAGMERGAVDLQLRSTNRYTVQLTLGSVEPGATMAFILQRRASPVLDVQTPRFETLPNNTFRLPDIYPGSYDIIVTAATPATGQPRRVFGSARIPVNITNDNVDLGTIPLSPSVPVTGKLVPADTLTAGLDANRLVLTLRPLETTTTFTTSIRGAPDASGFAGIQANGSLQFPPVAPGRYQITLTGLPGGAYVVGAREMGREILDTGYVITGNQGPLELVIGGSGSVTNVEGVVVNSRGEAVPFGIVALVPSPERRGNPAAFRTATADQSGYFAMNSLLPGDYSIFAWEEVEPGAWQNAEFLKPLENRGQPVRLQRGGQSVVNVRVIPAQ